MATSIPPEDSATLIKAEQKRLEEIQRWEKVRRNVWVRYLHKLYGIAEDDAAKIIQQAKSFEDFGNRVEKPSRVLGAKTHILEILKGDQPTEDFNAARDLENSFKFPPEPKPRATRK